MKSHTRITSPGTRLRCPTRAVALATFICGLAPSGAHAFALAPARIESPTITVEVDYDSFRGTPWAGEGWVAACPECSDADIAAWVRWAFAQWTGPADIELEVNVVEATSWSVDSWDGTFSIAVTPDACDQTPLAFTQTWVTGSLVTDSNIFVCPAWDLWVAAKLYTMRMSEAGPQGGAGCVGDPTMTFDLPALLVHEVGHFLGLDHTVAGDQEDDVPRTVMRANLAPGACGQFHSRYPTPDDVLGLRAAWDPNRAGFSQGAGRRGTTSRFRELTPTGWATPVDGPDDWISSDQPESRASVGEKNDTGTASRVIVTSLTKDWHSARVHRADYPISSSNSWTRKTLTGVELLGAPDVDARNHPEISDRWILVGAEYQLHMGTCDLNTPGSCGGPGGVSNPELFWSSDSFSTHTQVTLGGSTNITPAIAWHPMGRWIVAYQSRVYDTRGAAWGSGGGSDGHVMLRVSTNMSGNEYYPAIDTGVFTTAPPSVACSATECTLAWVTGDTHVPLCQMQRFTTTSTGVITWGPAVTVNIFTPGRCDVGVRGGSSVLWGAALGWNLTSSAASAQYWLNSLLAGTSAPPAGAFNPWLGAFVAAEPAIAAAATHTQAYLFFNEY